MHEKTARAVVACLIWDREPLHPDMGKIAANLLNNDLAALAKASGLSIGDLPEWRPDLAETLQDLCALRAWDILTPRHVKVLLPVLWATPYLTVIDLLVSSKLLEEAGEDAIKGLVQAVIADHPAQVAQIKAGKINIVGFLVGQTMKRAGGKADPSIVQAAIKNELAL